MNISRSHAGRGARTLAVSLATLASPTLAQTDIKADGLHTLPTNLFGAPLLERNQAPVEYSEQEYRAQEAVWYAQGGTIENGPLGGCETVGAASTWKWFDMGTGIGQAGFSVSPANGLPELVVTGGGFGFGGARYWQILRFNPSTGGYDQRFTSPVYDPGVRRMVSGDFDGIGGSDIVTVLDGSVETWDQDTLQPTGLFSCIPDAGAARLVDIDRDGSTELVVASSTQLGVYRASGAVVATLPFGGHDFAVGQMDADASLEIALSTGHVIDFDSRISQWFNSDTFGAHVEAGDIDGDGYDEVIGTAAWGTAWAYDVDTELPKWSISIFNTGATDLADVDGDGELELIIGEAQWGDQLIYDLTTRQVEAAINNPEHGTTEVIIADTDGDGVNEVVWGAGHSSTGEDKMFVGDWVTESHEWVSVDFDGPFRAPTIADLDGDGRDEILTLSNESDSGYGGGRMLAFDAETFALEAVSSEVADGLGWSGAHEVLVKNVDSDPFLELFVATSRTYDGRIEMWQYDGTEFTRDWFIQGDFDSNAVLDIEVEDIDGDGALEVIGAETNFVKVYDLATQALEWTTPFTLGAAIPDIEIANVDDDDALELIALAGDGDLAIFDGETQAVEALMQIGGSSVEISDAVLGADILRVGLSTGELVSLRHDGTSFVEIARVTAANSALEDLVLRGQQVVFAGVDEALRMYDVASGMEIWSSCRDYGSTFAEGVAFADDYIVTSGLYGLVVFARR